MLQKLVLRPLLFLDIVSRAIIILSHRMGTAVGVLWQAEGRTRHVMCRTSVAISASILCIAIASSAGEAETPPAMAKRLAASKEKKDRVQALQILKVLAKPGTAPGDEALARYGDLCLRLYAEGERSGLEEAKRAFTELKEKSHSRWALKAKVGLARASDAEGRREEAIKALDGFLSNQGIDDAFIEGAYYLGGILAEAKDNLADLLSARKTLEYCLTLWKERKNYYAGDLSEEDIKSRLAMINGLISDIKAGPVKLAFEKAEKLRQAGRFKEAIPAYEAVLKEDPEHILADCSGLRIGQCLEGLKKFAEARKHYEEFIKAKPLGAYRGHAHLQLGDIWLEQDFRAACAEIEYNGILHPEKYAAPDPTRLPDFWKGAIDPKIFQMRPDMTVPAEDPLAAEARQAIDAVRRKALIVDEIPKDAHGSWGEVIPDAHIRLGIVTYMRADFKTADAHFSTSFQMRPDERFGRGVPAGTLLLAEKCRRRELPVPAYILCNGGDRARVCAFLAGAYLEAWGADRALRLFERIGTGDLQKEANPEQVAYAICQMGECNWIKGDGDKAREMWRKFQKKPLDQTMTAPRALLKLGCTTFTKTQDSKDLKILETIYTKYPNSPEAPLALFQFASALCDSQPQQAASLLQLLHSRYPNSPHEGQIAGLIASCREREDFLKKWHADQQRKKSESRY